MKNITLAFLMLVFSTTVNAFSGAELLSQCKNFMQILDGDKTDVKQTLQAGLCGGYILGVQEGFVASSELSFYASEDQGTAPVSGKYWTIPEDVPDEQIVKIVVRYLEINSDMQSKPAVVSVINAIIQTYPVKPDD